MIHCKQSKTDPDWQKLKQQIDRLGGLDFFPKPELEPAAYKELVIALQCSNSIPEATAVIDDWAHGARECPKPADIRRNIHERHERVAAEAAKATSNCPSCGGSGVLVVQVGSYTGVKDCECRRVGAPA